MSTIPISWHTTVARPGEIVMVTGVFKPSYYIRSTPLGNPVPTAAEEIAADAEDVHDVESLASVRPEILQHTDSCMKYAIDFLL